MCQFCQNDKPEMLEYTCGWCGETRHHLLTQTETEAEVLCLWRDLPQDRQSQMLLILRYMAEHDGEMRESQDTSTASADGGGVPGSQGNYTTGP